MDSVDPTKDEEEVLIQGFRRSLVKSALAYTAVVLSGFTLLLLFYWKPEYHLHLTHVVTDTTSAERVLLINTIGEVSVCRIYVQYLWSNQTSPFKACRRAQTSETIPISEGVLKDGLPTSTKFFHYRSLKYIWKTERATFIPIKGLDSSLCSTLLRSMPLDNNRIDYLSAFYGPNVLDVPLTPIVTKIFREVITPFYVFQIFSVCLWMVTEYYAFASVILVFSVVSIFLAVYTCRRNEIQLRNKVKMVEQALVLRNNAVRELPSSQLVPGDILCIPKAGAEIPADVLLLNGDCIVNESTLTGESVPQTKTTLKDFGPNECLDFRSHSRYLLFSGTTALQARPALNHSSVVSINNSDYVKAVVLRTGFLTTKGSLVRSILYPKPLDIDFTLDCFRFLSVMTVIAIGGSIYTLAMLSYLGFKWYVMLENSLDILTIVVPPALPAIMTTGLFFAELRLKKLNIFCINPSAINIAGTLNTFVFDKTGTLTEDIMLVKGIWDSGCPLSEDYKFYPRDYLNDLHAFSSTTSMELDNGIKLLQAGLIQRLQPAGPIIGVLTACHSLALAKLPNHDDPQIVGDPLDIVIFNSTKWVLSEAAEEDVTRNFKSPVKYVLRSTNMYGMSPWHQIGILQHFPFSSTTQRQSVVVQLAVNDFDSSHPTAGLLSVLTKGSPEAVMKLCNPLTIPDHFDSVLQYFTGQGHRVLALAWKPLGRITDCATGKTQQETECNAWIMKYRMWRREGFECELRMLGLLILDNPIKPESEPTIRELISARFRLVMATGDDIRTGLSVARQCGFISRNDQVIQLSPKTPSTEPSSLYKNLLQVEVLPNLCASLGSSNRAAKGVVGQKDTSVLLNLLQNVMTYGISQHIGSMSDEERSLLQAAEEGTIGISTEVEVDVATKQHIIMNGETWNLILKEAPELIPLVISYGTVFARFLPSDKTSLVQAMQNSQAGYRVGMCGDGANDCGALKSAYVGIALSDCEASIAAPFTSQEQNIACVTKLLKEGRCSLSTAVGSFKYMVLYSFVQFFSVLILLYIGNVLSDAQYLIIDLFIVTPLTVTIATSHPWQRLEVKTPALRLLTLSNLLSVFSQLILVLLTQILVFCLVRSQPWWKKYVPNPEKLDHRGSYEATGVFYFSLYQYTTICMIFAKGPPFRDHTYLNKFFVFNVTVVFGLCLGLLFCPIPAIVKWAKFLPMHGDHDTLANSLKFPACLLLLAGVHGILAYLTEIFVEFISKKLCLGAYCSPHCSCRKAHSSAYHSIEADLQ